MPSHDIIDNREEILLDHPITMMGEYISKEEYDKLIEKARSV